MNWSIGGALALSMLALAAPAMAQQPTQAQATAIRSACRGDYQSVCAGVPTGGKDALQCLQQNAAKVSAGCQQALAPLGAPAAQSPAGAAAPAPAATAAPPPQPASPPMSKRAEMRLLRTDCGDDFRKFCAGVRLGGGRGLACLQAHGPQLAPQCQSALQDAARTK